MVVDHIFGEDPIEINEERAADRMGSRIREIRKARNLSQAELGALVGLNADRIQKYENGARKPKQDQLKKIASALGVSALALTDPVTANWLGVMYALFEMEKQFDLKIERNEDGKYSVCFGDGFVGSSSINDFLAEWYNQKEQMLINCEGASSKQEQKNYLNEYNEWKWNFPRPMIEKTKKERKELELQRIQDQIDKLEQRKNDITSSD